MSSIIANKLKLLVEKINKACEARPQELNYIKRPRLVAVSKLKPIEDICEAYSLGVRHFGENYVKELEFKSKSDLIKKNCPDIKWHFIGNLQQNKVNKLAILPNLYMVETVDSEAIVEKLNKAWASRNNQQDSLKIMIQVNTSREATKNGLDPNLVVNLYKNVLNKCNRLNLIGLMTIGSIEQSKANDFDSINNDFSRLIDVRNRLHKELDLDIKAIELSMGMSSDFEKAILMGSSSVRIGSLLFGERLKNK